MSRIPVLHIIKSLGRGGAEMLLAETLKLHDQSRFDFHYIYFLPWKDQMVAAIRESGGRVHCFKSRNNFELILKIRDTVAYVREYNIRLIHAHLPWAGILARVVGIITGVPVLYTEHNKQERYHWATRRMNLATMNLVTRIIAVSDDVSDSIHKNKRRLTSPLQTIVNGVNIDKFNSEHFTGKEVREKFNIPPEAPIVGTIAVFRFQKRLEIWMELGLKILGEVDNAHFIIVGDGPLMNELLAKRDALGLQDRIHMPGLETEVRPYLAAFDVYMMSSVFEGLPIAMLEAMAMQCPVISTDAGGIKEVIRHELDGLVCAVEHPHKLVEYAATLLKNQETRIKIGKQGRQRVSESFSMKKMVYELEIAYGEVLSGA